MNFKDAKGYLQEGEDFLISTHLNSDGDAIGSVTALSCVVRLMGKSCRIILHDPVPDPKYAFLDGFENIESYKPRLKKKIFDYAIIVDSPTISRIGNVASLIGTGCRILNIDHHRSNQCFGHVNLVDESASSTSEIIYLLAKSLKLRIADKMATHLYTGIMFDTGRFRYSNLERAFPAAADLVKLGAKPERIAEAVYGQRSYQSVKILGEALGSLKLYLGRQVAIMTLPFKFLQSSNDLDGIVDYAISISGVAAAALIKEQEPGKFRLSLRSRGELDVNEVAREFQGGGHPNAAGCYIAGEDTYVRNAILRAIGKRLKKQRPVSGKRVPTLIKRQVQL